MLEDVTAILLCGGKGERLRPFTETVPKPLVPLAGKPLLEHLMHYLAYAGIHKFVLCVGYKGEAIEAFLAEHRDEGWDAVCVDSGDATMTDRINDARVHVPGRALICYGDTLANVDLAALGAAHRRAGAEMTMTTYPLHSPFGIVEIEPGGVVSGFSEKPRLPHWINIGFMLCNPAALDHATRGTDMVPFLSDMARRRWLHAYKHEGRHLTVNTEKERQIAETLVVDFYTLPKQD